MKSLIRNALGEKIVSHYVPMTPANAETFASTFLEGTYKVYQAGAEVGTDVATTANDVLVFVSNTISNKKSYLRFIAPFNKSESDIRTTLIGLTVDGILIDYVSIINFAPMTFA